MTFPSLFYWQWRIRQAVRSNCEVAINGNRTCSGGMTLAGESPARLNKPGSVSCGGSSFTRCTTVVNSEASRIFEAQLECENQIKFLKGTITKTISRPPKVVQIRTPRIKKSGA